MTGPVTGPVRRRRRRLAVHGTRFVRAHTLRSGPRPGRPSSSSAAVAEDGQWLPATGAIARREPGRPAASSGRAQRSGGDARRYLRAGGRARRDLPRSRRSGPASVSICPDLGRQVILLWPTGVAHQNRHRNFFDFFSRTRARGKINIFLTLHPPREWPARATSGRLPSPSGRAAARREARQLLISGAAAAGSAQSTNFGCAAAARAKAAQAHSRSHKREANKTNLWPGARCGPSPAASPRFVGSRRPMARRRTRNVPAPATSSRSPSSGPIAPMRACVCGSAGTAAVAAAAELGVASRQRPATPGRAYGAVRRGNAAGSQALAQTAPLPESNRRTARSRRGTVLPARAAQPNAADRPPAAGLNSGRRHHRLRGASVARRRSHSTERKRTGNSAQKPTPTTTTTTPTPAIQQQQQRPKRTTTAAGHQLSGPGGQQRVVCACVRVRTGGERVALGSVQQREQLWPTSAGKPKERAPQKLGQTSRQVDQRKKETKKRGQKKQQYLAGFTRAHRDKPERGRDESLWKRTREGSRLFAFVRRRQADSRTAIHVN
jgi:hypothetical protein